MDCRPIRKLLAASIDDQLTPDEQRNVDAHVQSCSVCRAELADLRATVAHLRNVEQIEPPPWMTQKIMARIRAQAVQPEKSLWERLLGVWPAHVPLGAVATVMLTVFVIMVFRSIQPELTRDAMQEMPKQTVPAQELSLQKESAQSVAKPETVREPQRTKTDKTASEKPAMAPPAVQKEQVSPPVPTPRSGVSAPAAEQPAKTWKQDSGSLEDSARYEKSETAGDMVRTERYKMKKAAPAIRSGAPGVPPLSSITVAVADVDAAVAQVRAMIAKSGGRVVRGEPVANGQVITVELSPEQLTGFRAQLKKLGQVTERLLAVDDRMVVTIRMEVVFAK